MLFETVRKLAAPPEGNKLTVDTSTATTRHDAARQALADYLRAMRGRATPVNGTRTNRRRVRGLRREEVAVEAGISVTWYTWLEQGRPVRVSARTLRAVARALRLAPAERAHLLRLASAALGSPHRARLTRDPTVGLRAMVTNLSPHPAYAVNGVWEVLCRNRLADAVFGDFDREPGCTDNVLRRLLLDPEWRERFANWEEVAESAIAQFRAATGDFVGRSTWRQFVASLSADSPWFAERWLAQRVAQPVSYAKVVRHPTAGSLRMLYASLAPDGEPPDVRLIVYTPADADTARRIRRLCD